ncbi:MAG: DMT family transporter [Syntrophothermus sp.]
MPWIYLFIASICEISWAVGLKYSAGFTKPAASVFTAVNMLLSYIFLSQAVKSLPLGTAYAVWTGIGAAGTAIYGMLYFGESRETIRILFLLLIVCGVLGLKFSSK